MVRQIMEARGYLLDRSGVRIRRRGNLFFSGSRYRLPEQKKAAPTGGAAFPEWTGEKA